MKNVFLLLLTLTTFSNFGQKIYYAGWPILSVLFAICIERVFILYHVIKLEKILGAPINILSFQYDDYNDDIIKTAEQAGYNRVFSDLPTFPSSKISSYLMGRISVSPDDRHIEYWLKLRGAYQWLPFAVNIKRKLQAFRN